MTIEFIILALLLTLFIVLWTWDKLRSQQIEQRVNKEIENFKKKEDVVKLVSRSFEVISNTSYEEVPKSENMRIQMWDGILDPGNSTKRIRHDLSRIKLIVGTNDRQREFISGPILKDRTTLEFLLASQQEVDIYMEKGNTSRYYIDLEFLKEYSTQH